MTAWVASHAPECTELTVERDRGFESRFLQRRVQRELTSTSGPGWRSLKAHQHLDRSNARRLGEEEKPTLAVASQLSPETDGPSAAARFYIFIVDAGWNLPAHRVLVENFALIRQLQKDDLKNGGTLEQAAGLNKAKALLEAARGAAGYTLGLTAFGKAKRCRNF